MRYSEGGTPFGDVLARINEPSPYYIDNAAYIKSYRAYYGYDTSHLVGGVSTVARMPDGITPPMTWLLRFQGAPTEGIPAPSAGVNSSSFRSGSVYVFSPAISFSGAGGPKLIVAGVPGGTGGAGQPDPCVGFIGGTGIDCLAKPSGENSAGGPGGDAGVVVVYGPRDLKETVAGMVDISGGPPGRTIRFLSPRNSKNEHIGISGDISDFLNVGQFPPSISGAEGSLNYIFTNTPALLESFVQLVTRREALTDYDYVDLAKRADADQTISVKSFNSFMSTELDAAYRERVWYLMDGVLQLFRDGSVNPGTVRPQSVFCGEMVNPNISPAIDSYLSLLITVCGLPPSKAGLDAYMLRAGGYFGFTGQIDPTTRLDTEKTNGILAWSSADWVQAVAQLLHIRETEYAIYTEVKTQNLRLELSSLNAKISDLRTKIDAKRRSGTALGKLAALGKVAAALGEIGSGISSVNGTLDLLSAAGEAVKEQQTVGVSVDRYKNYTLDDRKEQFSKLGSAGQSVYSGATALAAALTLFDSNGDGLDSDLRQYLLQAKAIEDNIQQLAQRLAEEKRLINDKRLVQLYRGLTARLSFGSLSRATASNLHQLLISSIISYVEDPGRDIDRFQRNISTLASYMATFPFNEGNFEIGKINRNCSVVRRGVVGNRYDRGNEDCVRVDVRDKPVIIAGIIRSLKGDSVIVVPLYRIAAWGGVHNLALYGIRNYRILLAH